MARATVRRPGIKDIADALGISIGTVDRALYDRPGVSPTTRDRVLRMAKKLGYQPNIAARALKLHKRTRIAVQLPKEISFFFDPLREGVRSAAAASFGTELDLEFMDYPRFGAGDIELLRAVTAERYDGVLCAPGDASKAGSLINELQHRGVMVACVSSDVTRSERLTSVAIDGRVSGSLAAELLINTLQSPCAVASVTGTLRTLDHAEKLRGFAATLALFAPHLSLLPALEAHDDPREAYQQAKELLERRPGIRGLYVSTANSLSVLRAVRENKRAKQIRVVTTDLFPELASMIEAGDVMATLYQRPFRQGRVAMLALLRYLTEGVRPPSRTLLAPHIVLRSNLPIFSEYVSNPSSIPA